MVNKGKIDTKLLLAALDSSHDGIHILDKSGNTLYINQTCCEMEGVMAEQVHNHNVKELVEQGIYSDSVTLKVLETNQVVSIMQKAFNGRLLLVTGTPIYENGVLDKIFVNTRDITELNELREQLSKASDTAIRYKQELEVLRRERATNNIVCRSKEMDKTLKIAKNVAGVDSTILITGESGVGKGMLAKFIHDNSTRCNGPFITIDCSAIPESLFESELFGYVSGAFTGAAKGGKKGLMELADGGTVFLDEIGELPMAMQAKLLRAIQDKVILPVGGDEYKKLDVRYISATNKKLEDMVAEGTFREDLYYRLNVVPLEILPLRQRRDDVIPILAEIVNRINDRYGWEKTFDDKFVRECLEYSWPGNVRQLENVIERVMVSSDKNKISADTLSGVIESADIVPDTIEGASEYQKLIADYDTKLLMRLIESEGSITLAAKKINVAPSTIRRKLQRYGKNK
ncbi:MAG: sigma 54-interacting transcriptional regulator [Bacillota bacterium]|nr:sigma 54-interacting transcriptional regulator [Bacillota bacterium]